MSIFVTEHAGYPYRQNTIPRPIAAYALTSASVGPLPQVGTNYIRVTADAGSLLNINSASTAITLTSTNSFRIPANVGAELFDVNPTLRIQAAST